MFDSANVEGFYKALAKAVRAYLEWLGYLIHSVGRRGTEHVVIGLNVRTLCLRDSSANGLDESLISYLTDAPPCQAPNYDGSC